MTPQQFIDLVCKLRSAQKQYFRTRSLADLDESKKLEREVDQAIRELTNPYGLLALPFDKSSS
jgi:hypothetical protein